MTEKKPYFPTLESEIARAGIKKKALAVKLNITNRTLSKKLSGETEFTWSEVLSLSAVFPTISPVQLLSHE